MNVNKINVKNILTKSPVHRGYTANPYNGCMHDCVYCYARYLKDWTGHENDRWGEYVDVKYWNPITNKQKDELFGKRVTISSATDPYQDIEAEFGRTHALLEELEDTGAEILVITKSCNVVWDAEILKRLDAKVAISINTLDEKFRSDMDKGSCIDMRFAALEALHKNGIYTICFISPVFPGITDVPSIVKRVENYVDEVWVEHLVLSGSYKGQVMFYIRKNYPDLYVYYDSIFNKNNLKLWWDYDDYLEQWAYSEGYIYSYSEIPNIGHTKPIIINHRGHKGK